MTKDLFAALHETKTRNDILDGAMPALPEDARTWLGRLTLLYGVPFQYLVPDEKMLQAESLRFFYVDPLWMEALFDGALSIGRPEDVRRLLNKAMAGTYANDLIKEARKIRPQQQAGADGTATELAERPIEGAFEFSGFLLRSEIVAGWRGLAVSGYAGPRGRGSGKPLATLRLERLARDILFGLFEGHLQSLEIVQPPEGLHFELPVKSPATSPSFTDERRVFGVGACRSSQSPEPDNSAAFAVSLLASPARYTFSIGD
ncbi:MAG: hypothetical protein ACREFP_22560 [Acetobacteraceae bacterium]